mmetsp:Transcript_17982/g.27782  ORF Transcript_17982/g.27782 Transcript_17982/m.27782 type:complete len:212 (-) Transcript_17982:1506-2141(-)
MMHVLQLWKPCHRVVHVRLDIKLVVRLRVVMRQVLVALRRLVIARVLLLDELGLHIFDCFFGHFDPKQVEVFRAGLLEPFGPLLEGLADLSEALAEVLGAHLVVELEPDVLLHVAPFLMVESLGSDVLRELRKRLVGHAYRMLVRVQVRRFHVGHPEVLTEPCPVSLAILPSQLVGRLVTFGNLARRRFHPQELHGKVWRLQRGLRVVGLE